MNTPRIWSVLSSDDSVSLVVPEGTDPAVALAALVVEEYGGDEIDPTHPLIVAEVAMGLKVCQWRRYSSGRAEEEGIDTDYNGWCGPGGDLGEPFWVLHFGGDIHSLGDDIAGEVAP